MLRRIGAPVRNITQTTRRTFGSHGHGEDHGHAHGPHIPEFHAALGKVCLVTAFFWIMYRAKENKGQLIGLYKPWLHEHEHLHFQYEQTDGYSMPTLVTSDEHEHDHEHEESHEHH